MKPLTLEILQSGIREFVQIRNEVDSDDEDLEREVKQKILDSISLDQGQLGSELVTVLMKSVAQKKFCPR